LPALVFAAQSPYSGWQNVANSRNGFGTSSCSFSGFQPCKTANFKVAVPKLKFWNSLK
jgi:hypothetical protein